MIPSKAWAQAVKVDGTVIILSSGNCELICLRHRATKTLYVSDLIEPPKCSDPGYGKLHVGIFVAAVQDAMDRMMQSVSTSSPSGSDDNTGDGPEEPDLGGHDNDGHGGRGGRGGGGKSRSRGRQAKTGRSHSNTGNKVADVCESVAVKVCLFGLDEHPS